MKEDGTMFVCIVDGRGAGGSVGLTVEGEAQLAGALGAQYSLELDGGGSSTMIVRIDDKLTLRNIPSDGSMRKVANVILLVEKPAAEENPGEDNPGTDNPGENNPGENNPGEDNPDTNPDTGLDDGDDEGENAFVAFFKRIFEAIANFFRKLFSGK
jgi:hypothetical protein